MSRLWDGVKYPLLQLQIANPSGRRPIWQCIWGAQVPLKMRITAWKVVSGALATNACKKYRHISTRDTCPLCGSEETSFHALISCEHARKVWEQIRTIWILPEQDLLVDSGKDWLLNILASCTEEMRERTIMLIWRIWSLRSDLAHGKEVPSPAVTADYLQSYMRSLSLSRTYTTEELMKGKMSEMEISPVVHNRDAAFTLKPWPRPPVDRAALSVDGAFSQMDGSAATGMILRRQNGSVIFAAYRCLFNCNDALEAELHALMQGMALAVQHCNLPIIVQSDSSVALLAMTGTVLAD